MKSTTLAIVGSGGAGVAALGEMLLKAAASVGYFGILRKCFGPQIRGGESAAILRLASTPVSNLNGDMDFVIALDWHNFSRFEDEIPIHPNTQILQDSQAGTPPTKTQPIQSFDFTGIAASVGSSKANMVLLGFLGGLIDCPSQTLERFLKQRLQKLTAEQQSVSVAAMTAGQTLAQEKPVALPWPERASGAQGSERWVATGNQLAGLGALEAGIRFVAAYPITPASDAMEWMAHHIESVGGHLLQAEDELAAINMVIGAGYGGTPAMTATSGPGLALMSEAMGLAVASETPTVILNVMRGGPSTGIPTKSEQSDLNLALFGLHGDAPHVVLSSLGVEDCFATTAWATQLACDLQTLVIVLSDQFIGQAQKIITPLPETPFKAQHARLCDAERLDFARYRDTETGISIMASPGEAECMFTADGLEHNEKAVPSPRTSDHQRQLDKRARKIHNYPFGAFGLEVQRASTPDAVAILCWGSLHSIALEAQLLLAQQHIGVSVIALRQLLPLPQSLERELQHNTQLLVVEQNHSGQLFHYLQGCGLNLPELRLLAKPGPSSILPRDIVSRVLTLTEGLTP